MLASQVGKKRKKAGTRYEDGSVEGYPFTTLANAINDSRTVDQLVGGRKPSQRYPGSLANRK